MTVMGGDRVAAAFGVRWNWPLHPYCEWGSQVLLNLLGPILQVRGVTLDADY